MPLERGLGESSNSRTCVAGTAIIPFSGQSEEKGQVMFSPLKCSIFPPIMVPKWFTAKMVGGGLFGSVWNHTQLLRAASTPSWPSFDSLILSW